MKISSLKKIIKRDDVVATAPALPKKAAAPKKVAVKKVAVKKAVTKTAKPAAAKKAPAKKAATKKAAAKRLVVASDSESFWVTNGHVLNSLVALEMAFADMSKAVYEYHISATGSDFADWVEAVLFEQDCASELRKAKTAKAAHGVVTKYLKQYSL
jgi:hypothetical protein